MDPDDIFDYQPLKRQKKSVSAGRFSPIVNIIPNEGRISDDLKSAPSLSHWEETPTVKVEATSQTSNISSTEKNDSLTYCPICQISSDIFFLNARNIKKWSDHLSTCLDKFPKKILKECPRGMSCNVKSVDHYRKFQHSSLASLRGNVLLYKYSSISSSENEEKKYSMTKEFLNERNKETNPVSLPISEGTHVEIEDTSVTPVKSDNIPLTNSYNQLPFQQSHAKEKKIDVEVFKIFSSQPSPKNAAKSPAKSTPRKKRTTKLSDPFITPKKGVNKSPAKSTPRKRSASKLSDPFKTPQKGITKSPAKSTLKESLSSKSPLLKDLTQQTFTYDPNQKAMVLTPQKSPTPSPVSKNSIRQTLMYNSTKKALMLTPQKSQRMSLNDTTEKPESSCKWENLSIRKANVSNNNSRLLSALTKEDSHSCSSTKSSPNLQGKKLQSRIALNIGDSDAGPSDILVSSELPQLSNSPQCKSLLKPKSDKSYVTVLFVSSDSENECDVQTKTSYTQSSRKFSNSEGNSLSTQPTDNLDFSSKSEGLSIRKTNASGNNSHRLSVHTKENSLSCSSIESSPNLQRKKLQSRIAFNIGDSDAGPSNIVSSERPQLSDSSRSKLKSDKSDVPVLFVSSDSEDECDVQKVCSQSSRKSSDSKSNSSSTQPTDNLDFSSKSEGLSIRKTNASGNNSHRLSVHTKENSLSSSSIENSPNLQRKKLQSRITFNIGDSDAGPSNIVSSERPQLSDSSRSKLKSDKSDVTVLFVLSNSEDECDVQKVCSQSSRKSSDSKSNSSSTQPSDNSDIFFTHSNETSVSLSSQGSSKKAESFSTCDSDQIHLHTASNSPSIESEYYFSDDELNLLLIPEEVNPSTNAVEVKNNHLFSKSSPLLPVPLKLPVCSPSKKASENVTSLSTNQMRLAPIFTRKPLDKQSIVSMNVDSNETKSKPTVLSNPAHENKTRFSIEENPRRPVMELEQFKNMFAKKSSPKNCLSTFKSEQLPQVIPEVQSVKPDSYGQKFTSCPFYKKIPDTAITVDAFKYGLIPGCRAYFLSHFHYDHYQGITKNFRQPIYCSQVTANLLKVTIGIASEYIHPLPLYCPVVIEGVNVTLLDANHCPGAVLMLFKTKYNKVILHTGDFRADSIMEEYTALKNIKIHQLFLDTTYCNESYAFPSQRDILDLSVSLAELAVKENSKTLIVVGAYTIGKEKVFLEIAKAIKSKIGVTKVKKKILDCQENSHLNRLVSLNLNECQVHVVKMNLLTYKNLSEHLIRYKNKFDRIIAFKPTGWTHSDKNNTLSDIKPSIKTDNIILYGLPYSEHSSFLELKRFVQFVQPDKIIPTVNNGKPSARKTMDEIFKSWLSKKPTVMENFFPSFNKS